MTADHESLRRVIQDADIHFLKDLSKYEHHREEQRRDYLIAYARSARDKLIEGRSLEWVMERLQFEVPEFAKDPVLLSELLNYFLNEINYPLQFDTDLNMLVDGVEVLSSGPKGAMGEAFAKRKEKLDAIALEASVRYGDRIAGLSSRAEVESLLSWLVVDVVYYGLDNALVSEYLNLHLKTNGSVVQVDRYLRVIDN